MGQGHVEDRRDDLLAFGNGQRLGQFERGDRDTARILDREFQVEQDQRFVIQDQNTAAGMGTT
jgi:hypothetical protein